MQKKRNKFGQKLMNLQKKTRKFKTHTYFFKQRQGNVVNGTSPFAKQIRKFKKQNMFQRNANMRKYKKATKFKETSKTFHKLV